MKKIKELQKRSTLQEGRDYGIGFSILNKIGSKFETYLPFTACRDYLNDFIFVEKFKTEIGTAYGYNHKLLNCFKYKKYFYIGVKSLNFNYSGVWEHQKKAEEILISNYKNLEKVLNIIEEKLGLKYKTIINLDEDTLILKVPIYWSKSTPLISVYTLLIRCYFNINECSEINEETLNSNKVFIDADQYFKKECIKFFNYVNIFDFTKINYKMYDITSTDWKSVHYFGIQNFLKKI